MFSEALLLLKTRIVLARALHLLRSVVRSIKLFAGLIASQLLPIRTPKVVSGEGTLSEMGKILSDLGVKRPLIVTSGSQVRSGAVQRCIEAVAAAGLKCEVFDAVTPDPTSGLVERGFTIYSRNGCDSLVAIGGGSPIDCAKVIAAKAANPQQIAAYEGFLSVALFGLYGRPPPLVAVPTTAGSGAETTIAAVITLEEQSRKITIADPELVPRVAVFDSLLIKGLPQSATAATGMDALTHAVESFLSGWSTRSTRQLSLRAVQSISGSLTACYQQGGDLRAREAMLNGSFDAGLAFTRASVGYVHAIAHQFGAIFHTPHGEANAMLLPLVLDFYLQGEAPGSPLSEAFCELGMAAGIAREAPDSMQARHHMAHLFVAHVRKMNQDMSLPSDVPELRAEAVKGIAVRALREAHGQLHGFGLKWLLDLGYPVPKEMDLRQCQEIVAACLPASERLVWKASWH